MTMSSKLSSANTFMRDPIVRRDSVRRSVATSSAIEGIRAPFRSAKAGQVMERAQKAVTARRSPKR
jgi:hypothetical protein